MDLKLSDLQHIYPSAQGRAARFLAQLNDAMKERDIDTPRRVCMFLAQVGEESGQLTYTREIWGPTPQQMKYERDFNEEWTKDNARNSLPFELGNSEAGDGFKFRGRGLIQITGRTNYARTSIALFGDESFLLDNPEPLEFVEGACRSAAYFWHWKGCNAFADVDDLVGCTRRVNGGLTHYDRRHNFWVRAKEVLGD